MSSSRAVGLVAGVLLDAVLGDPRRGHPVAAFGSFAAAVEKPLYADDRRRGALFVAATVAPVAIAGVIVEKGSRRRWLLHAATTAAATWAVVGAHSLAREGHVMAAHLAADELPGARRRLSHLCGRNPAHLDEPELARATVESMAENTSDAVVASLLWGAVAGIPGLLAHRTINTLDAMVGHRNDRYRHFGTAAAKLDDVVNYVPARLTGLLACALAPVVGGSTAQAAATMQRDHANHPSPNGGWCESAWAGALGVQLGGENVYFGRSETRGLLGDGPRPTAADTHRAAHLVTAVTGAATVLAAGIALWRKAEK